VLREDLLFLVNQNFVDWPIILNLHGDLHYGIFYNSINNEFVYRIISLFYIYRETTEQFLDVTFTNRFILSIKVGYLDWRFIVKHEKIAWFRHYMLDYFEVYAVAKYYKHHFVLYDYLLHTSHRYYFSFKLVWLWLFKQIQYKFFIIFLKKFIVFSTKFFYLKLIFLLFKAIAIVTISSICYIYFYYYYKKNIDEFFERYYQFKLVTTFNFYEWAEKIEEYVFSKDLYKFLPFYKKSVNQLILKLFDHKLITFINIYFEIVILFDLFFFLITTTIWFLKYEIYLKLVKEIYLFFVSIKKFFGKLFEFIWITDEFEKLKASKYWMFMIYLHETKKNISSIRWNDATWGMYSEDWNDHRDYYIYNEEIAEYDHFRRIWMDLDREDIEAGIGIHFFWNKFLDDRLNIFFKVDEALGIRFLNYKFFFYFKNENFIKLSYYELYFWLIYLTYYNLYLVYYFKLIIKFMQFFFFKRYLARYYLNFYLSIYFVYFKNILLNIFLIRIMLDFFNRIKGFFLNFFKNNETYKKYFNLFFYYSKLIYIFVFRKTFYILIMFVLNWYFFLFFLMLFLLFFFDILIYTYFVKQLIFICLNYLFKYILFIFFEIVYVLNFKINYLIFFDFSGYLVNYLDSHAFTHDYFYSYSQHNLERNLKYYRKLWKFAIYRTYDLSFLRIRPRHLKWKWIEKAHRRFIIYFVWFKVVGASATFSIRCNLFFYFFYIYFFLKWVFVYFLKILYIYIKKITVLFFIIYYLIVLKNLILFIFFFSLFYFYTFISINGGEVIKFFIGNIMIFLKLFFIMIKWLFFSIFRKLIYIKFFIIKFLLIISHNVNFILNKIIDTDLIFLDGFYMLCNINEYFITTLKNMYLYFHYPINEVKVPKWGRWRFYYTRKLHYILGEQSIFKPNKIFFKDENSFFMFHNFIDLNFVKNSFMKIDLHWSFNFFFIYLIYYLFNYIVIIFILTVLFKKMQNILREKKLINFDFFYNWQRMVSENYDRLTNYETKIFTNLYNKHYAWHEFSRNEGEMLLVFDEDWYFNKWKLLETNVRTSLYRTKQNVDGKYNFFEFVYYNLYVTLRFLNINKKIKQMYTKKIRSIRERNQNLKELEFLVPFKYYKNFSTFKWLRKLEEKENVWDKLAMDFFYNIEAKMLFVLNEENFKKFYNVIDLLEEFKEAGKNEDIHWLNYLHNPYEDGIREIIFSSVVKNKIPAQVDLFNDIGISFEKIVLVDWDEDKTVLPKKIFLNINEKLEWLYYFDKKLNSYFNFYLYEFWKQDLFLTEVLDGDLDYWFYFSENSKIEFQFNKLTSNLKQDFENNDINLRSGDMVEKNSHSKFIIHEVRNETLLYLWTFIICFYFFWLVGFYTKYTLMTKRQIFHVMKFFWYFLIIFVQIFSMKWYLFLFYNTLHNWKFYNGFYYEDEAPLYRIFFPREWLYKRKLQYEFWRLNVKWSRFYQFNIWDWKDVYYLQICYLVTATHPCSLIYGDFLHGNYWLLEFLIFFLVLYYLFLVLEGFVRWFILNNQKIDFRKNGLFNKEKK
jgi:hypothetical protein